MEHSNCGKKRSLCSQEPLCHPHCIGWPGELRRREIPDGKVTGAAQTKHLTKKLQDNQKHQTSSLLCDGSLKASMEKPLKGTMQPAHGVKSFQALSKCCDGALLRSVVRRRDRGCPPETVFLKIRGIFFWPRQPHTKAHGRETCCAPILAKQGANES